MASYSESVSRFCSIFFSKHPFQEIRNGREVSFPVGHIAHAVPGGGKGQQGLICGAAAGTVLPPHGAGDEAVVLAVEEEDGRVAA